jgi:hypothetical protein
MSIEEQVEAAAQSIYDVGFADGGINACNQIMRIMATEDAMSALEAIRIVKQACEERAAELAALRT